MSTPKKYCGVPRLADLEKFYTKGGRTYQTRAVSHWRMRDRHVVVVTLEGRCEACGGRFLLTAKPEQLGARRPLCRFCDLCAPSRSKIRGLACPCCGKAKGGRS